MGSKEHSDDGTVVLWNRRILLVRRPDGLPKPEDFRLEVQELRIPSQYFSRKPGSEHGKASLVLETLYVSIDPAMRGWMSSAKSYLPPVRLGSVMRASAVCRIVAASTGAVATEYPIGCVVKTEIVGVQSYYVLENCNLGKARKLMTRLNDPVGLLSPGGASHSLSYASYLGVLGTTGLTAYFGLLRVGRPTPKDIVLVSGAAGATGSIVAQIAKHVIGCRKVIGTAGTDAKCRWLEENQIVDVAINYKTTRSLFKAIGSACGRSGVGVVFDNVGSTFLEASLSNLAMGARVVLCGAISQYNVGSSNSSTISGPRNYMNLLVKRASMAGFVVLDYRTEFSPAVADLVQWIQQGKIVCYQEDLRQVGIDNFYPALLSLFKGTNIGKVVLTVQPQDKRPRSRL